VLCQCTQNYFVDYHFSTPGEFQKANGYALRVMSCEVVTKVSVSVQVFLGMFRALGKIVIQVLI